MAAGSGVYESLSQFSTAAASSSSLSLSGRDVAHQFIAHFYKTLAQDISSLYSLYDDDSTVIRVDSDEEKNAEKPAWYTDKAKKGQVEINAVSIALPVSKVHIKSFDVCESGQEFLLLVDGILLFQHKTERSFSHAFLLAPLAGNAGYYIKNEILRFHARHHQQHAPQAPQQASTPVHQPQSHVHVHHTQTPSEDALNHHAHAHPHAHAHAHTHAHPASDGGEIEPQKIDDSADHSHADGSAHSHTSSPNKSPLKAGKEKRRKRHEASQVEQPHEQKQVEEQLPSKVEEVLAVVEVAPVVAVSDAAAVAAVVESAVAAVVEEKVAAPVEIQLAVAPVVASPAAVVAAVPKEEKKPRSWAHVVTKNVPAASAAAQPATAAAVAALVVKPVASAPAAAAAVSARPARELPGTVLVSGVPATAKNDDVKLFFSSFGAVTNTRAVTAAGKTSVYVTFASNAAANAAANQSNINFLGVQLQVSRSSAPAAAESEGDDGFQQTQNRRHARAQERKQEKQAPTFTRGGARGGRGRGARGGGRGGRGGAQAAANGTQTSAATPAATSG